MDIPTNVDMVYARIATLFEAIKHGSQEHQDWLYQAIEDHFKGKPVKKR